MSRGHRISIHTQAIIHNPVNFVDPTEHWFAPPALIDGEYWCGAPPNPKKIVPDTGESGGGNKGESGFVESFTEVAIELLDSGELTLDDGEVYVLDLTTVGGVGWTPGISVRYDEYVYLGNVIDNTVDWSEIITWDNYAIVNGIGKLLE